MATQVELVATSELSDGLSAAINDLDRRVDWGEPPEMPRLVWAGQAPWNVLVRVDGRLASRLGIQEREIRVDGWLTRVAGIAGVMTEPEFQGQGHATAALARATDFIRDELRVPFALLIALEHRRSFYARLGWQVLDIPVFCDQPDGKTRVNVPGRHAMVRRFESAELPAVSIDLCGLPW